MGFSARLLTGGFGNRALQPPRQPRARVACSPCRGAFSVRLRFASNSRRWFPTNPPPALLTDRVLSESGTRPGAPGRDRRGGKGADHPHHGAGSRAPNERVTIRTGPDDGRGVARRTRAGQLTPEL